MASKQSPFRLPRKTRSGIPELAAEWLLGLRALDSLYRKKGINDYDSHRFLKWVLNIFQVQHKVVSGSLERIPAEGPAVVVANHPYGGIEGVALAELLLQRRKDVRVLTNEILRQIPELRELFIGVDVLSKNARQKNKAAIAEAQRWVSDGHLLLMFPSGEVSSFNRHLKQVTDPTWRITAAKIAREARARVIPVFVEGRNGWLFQALGMIHSRLRTVRLIRELINKKGHTIGFRIGKTLEPGSYETLDSDSAVTNYLRLHTYAMSTHSSDNNSSGKSRSDKNSSGSMTLKKTEKKKERQVEGIASPVDKTLLQKNIEQLPKDTLLLEKNEMSVFCATKRQLPHILPEIGRLREVTFREVGEGTGLEADIDRYDDHYRHLFLWNRKQQEVVGAYRIGQVDQILRAQGLHGIYSRSLFRYHADFLHKLGSSLEMGRSFVRPEYQKSLTALMLLWKGIGAYVVANPRYKVLFGPVSISSHYSEISRQLMAGCLSINNSDEALQSLVQPTTPLKSHKGQFWSVDHLQGLSDVDKLSTLVQQIEKDNKGIPVLLKQYLKLSGELAAFNVDPAFNNALDGLIIVDLTRVDNRTLSKYLGTAGAKSFQDFHRPAA